MFTHMEQPTHNHNYDHNSGFNSQTLTILASLSSQATNASLQIRHSALSQLSRAVLGPLVPEPTTRENPTVNIQMLFDEVLFPMIEEQVQQGHEQRKVRGGKESKEETETRVRAATVVCKAFMRFEVRDFRGSGSDGEEGGEGREDEVKGIWVRVLEGMDKLMGLDRTDQIVRSSLSTRALHSHESHLFSLGTSSSCFLLWRSNLVRSRPRIPQKRRSRHERSRHARPPPTYNRRHP